MTRWELEIAVAAVREAAGLCRRVQGGIGSGVMEKSDSSPVTVADYGSQALICRRIEMAFPQDEVVGEENAEALRMAENRGLAERVTAETAMTLSGVVERVEPGQVCDWIDRGAGSGTGGRHWTLDPIDGTKGFIRGEQYAVALALIEEGEVTVCAMACPNLPVRSGGEEKGVVFMAERGGGAWAEPLEGGARTRITVSSTEESGGIRFCQSVETAHSDQGAARRVAELLGVRAEPVRMDSLAKYGEVARGGAELYLRLPTSAGYFENIWDHASGVLLVTEAGGRVTDIHGATLDFGQGKKLAKNRGIVASNGRVHEAVLAAIGRVMGRGD